MLSSVQNDLLSLTFNVSGLAFVNVNMDLAGMGPVACPGCGGPFGFAGQTPIFDLTLYDTPTSAFNINNPGSSTALSTAAMTGSVIASTTTLGWDNRTVSLATSGNANGNVTLLIDLRAGAAGWPATRCSTTSSSPVRTQPGDTTPPTTPPVPEAGRRGCWLPRRCWGWAARGARAR